MCKFLECPKSSNCLRFLAQPDEEQVYMRFYNICSESNSYQWYWQAPNELIKKEDDVNEK